MKHLMLFRASVLAAAVAGASRASAAPTLTTLVTFDGTNGSVLRGGLVADAAGNLYGTASAGGTNGDGVAFELAAGTRAFSTLATFDHAVTGSVPTGDLAVDAAGNLYGTTRGTTQAGTANQAGSVFQVAAGTRALTTLAAFDNAGNGGAPLGGVRLDAAGNLYGTAYAGGTGAERGTVFTVQAGAHAISTLATFTSATGAMPAAGVVADAAGNLFGTTSAGGSAGDGTVFEVAAGTHLLSTLATFTGGNGSNPVGDLLLAGDGTLYGTTRSGGANSLGTVFKVAPGSQAVTTLASFDGANAGSAPQGGLLADAAGNLFGTTSGGGAGNNGTVFEIPAGTQTLTTLAAFTGTGSAGGPFGNLLADAQGNLYGTTARAGANGDGTVFELSGAGFVVPEPASAALLACALPSLLARRRRDAVV